MPFARLSLVPPDELAATVAAFSACSPLAGIAIGWNNPIDRLLTGNFFELLRRPKVLTEVGPDLYHTVKDAEAKCRALMGYTPVTKRYHRVPRSGKPVLLLWVCDNDPELGDDTEWLRTLEPTASSLDVETMDGIVGGLLEHRRLVQSIPPAALRNLRERIYALNRG